MYRFIILGFFFLFINMLKFIIVLFDINVVYGLICLVVYVDSNIFKMYFRKCIICKIKL